MDLPKRLSGPVGKTINYITTQAQETGTDIYGILGREYNEECKTLNKAWENKTFQDAMVYLFSEISDELMRNEYRMEVIVTNQEGVADGEVAYSENKGRHGGISTSTRTIKYRQNILDAVFSEDNKKITDKSKKIIIQIIEYAFKATNYAQRLLTRMLNKGPIGKKNPYVTATESIFRDEKGRIDASRIYNELIKKVNAMTVE